MPDPTIDPSRDPIFELFRSALFDDLQSGETFPEKRPLLAHYTTVQVLEKILTNSEIWFSNPLYMNDLQEVRFGINEGYEVVLTSEEIEAGCGTTERAQKFREAFTAYYYEFANDQVLNTYVFCCSEHSKEDDDGRLSMWRGYGANGNGVAIVFDSAQIGSVPGSPLLIAKVDYESTDARVSWLRQLASKACWSLPDKIGRRSKSPSCERTLEPFIGDTSAPTCSRTLTKFRDFEATC
jgi:Protein of unknown function (DUF2971)